ncbi:MAG: NAD-dependent epimerase/dehydratase family protein [Deltaproteobacteria bacterium]|nr:NAD-dependent epimerase/dehydratase family protein [Deltaproteobacteria bacterium]
MTVLITGAPGWLGTRLVARFTGEGQDVRCLVEPGRDAEPVERLGATVERGDVRDAAALERAARSVELVVHCAGVVHPERFGDYHAIHVEGTRNAVQAASRAGARRFCHVSSEAAQGYNTDHRPLTEEQPCRPETEYGRTKREAELVVLESNRRQGLETVVLRPAMFYGPGQPERRSRLMRMIASGRPPLFGDGLNRRSMVYVDNLVDAVGAAATVPGIGGEVFWVADTEVYTTRGFFRSIADALGVPLRPRRFPLAAARLCRTASRLLERVHVHSLDLHVVGESPRDFFCANDKARHRLGWSPRIALADGVREAVVWWLTHERSAGAAARLESAAVR